MLAFIEPELESTPNSRMTHLLKDICKSRQCVQAHFPLQDMDFESNDHVFAAWIDFSVSSHNLSQLGTDHTALTALALEKRPFLSTILLRMNDIRELPLALIGTQIINRTDRLDFHSRRSISAEYDTLPLLQVGYSNVALFLGSRRNKLVGILWIMDLQSLICCSIQKSIVVELLDDLQVRNKVDAIFKVLVSIFDWASGRDYLMDNGRGLDDDISDYEDTGYCTEDLEILHKLVQRDRWEARGIKSTKDFLMGIADGGFYDDGTYRGFYVVERGLEEHKKAWKKRQRHNDPDSSDSPGAL